MKRSRQQQAVLARLERAGSDLRTFIEQRFDGVDQRLGAVDQRLDAVDQRAEETRAHLTMLIHSVADDVRIFAEAHVALERRVTGLERRPR